MRNLKIFFLALVIIGLATSLFFLAEGGVTVADVPKDVPIISGKVLSAKTNRSDELKRGIEVAVETNLSLPEAAQYYTDEFAKRGIRPFGMPVFWGNGRGLENSSEASGGGETRDHNQVMVYLRSEEGKTLVTISVLGNSMVFLPK